MPATSIINPTNTTPVPISQSVPQKWKHSVVERNEEYINDTSTHQVPITKAIDDEADIFENFYTPHKKAHSTPNLDTLQNYYDNNPDDDILYTNPIASVNDIEKEPRSDSVYDDIIKKQKERNAMSLANYHSKADNFTVE